MSRALALFVAFLSINHGLSIGHGVMAAEMAAPGLEDVTLEDLQATRSQPLFSPQRRAPQPPTPMVAEETDAIDEPAPPTKTQTSPGDFLLVGILLSNSLEIALLRDGQTGIVTRVPSGNDYGGWRLTVLGPRQIRLEGKEGSIVRSLFQNMEETASTREVETDTKSTGLWR